MKITKEQLEQIIREETSKILNEADGDPPYSRYEQDLIKNLNSILQSYWQPGNKIGDESEFAQQFKLAKSKLSSEFQDAYDLQAQKYINHMNWKRKEEEEYEAEFPDPGGL